MIKTSLILLLTTGISVAQPMPPRSQPPEGQNMPPPRSGQDQGGQMMSGFTPPDGRRPVVAISKDLGVTPEQFRQCFSGVRPAPQGERPTGPQVHANKQVLLNCLQKANPSIDNASLDAVMDKYRPGGREAQQPR